MLGRVERYGLPDPAAAGLPRVVIVFPRLAAGIAGLGHGIKTPELFPVFHVERRDPSARAAVTRAVLDEDLAVGDERRRQEFFLAAELLLHRDLPVPDDLAVLAVDRDDAAVRQVREDLVLPQRDAARARRVAFVLDARIADPDVLREAGIARVDLVDGAPAVRRVHVAVVDER